jgi:nicotinamidase-related amidase
MESNRAIHPNSTDDYSRSFLTSEFTAFHPDLIRDLRREQITKVYLIGGWWEHCITATALHARSLGFDVVIVDSAVGGSSELHPMAKHFLGNLSFRFEGVPQLPSYKQPLGKTPLSFTDLAQSSGDELAMSNLELAMSNSELRNWIDGWFVAHWDLNSFGAKVAGDFVRFPYKRNIHNMTLVIFDACNSINNSEHRSSGVLDLFVQKGSSVYLADTETCTTLATLQESAGVDVIQEPTSSDILRALQTRLTSMIEQKGHTVVLAGNVADDSMIALSYWMFDRDYDVFLIHDATYWRGADHVYSAAQKTQTMQVICHAVVAVGLTSDLLRLEDTPLPQSLSYFDKFLLSQDNWAKVVREEEPTRMGPMPEERCVAMCDERSMEVCGGVSWDSDTQSCFMFSTIPIHRLLQQPERDATGLHNPHKLRIKTMQSSKKYSDNELCRL